jgi:WD40 repeat protein
VTDALGPPPRSPFKGLAAFADSEVDALFFFGREREREVIVANLLASRLTVLYGESGVGKSSLLGAGVARELRTRAPDAEVALHNTWSEGSVSLNASTNGDERYLILDQFEEYFLYHGAEDGEESLLRDLPELLRDTRANVLIALREDSLAQLDAFKARIPSVFANQIRLDHLDRAAARAAILGPLGRWNELIEDHVEIEPALVDAVLDEVAVAGRAGHDHIEAPYLQLVLERLWDTERLAGSGVLRLETLRRLGGASTIVRDHLRDALAGLEPGEQDVAAAVFEHLVTPSGTKIAHGVADLADYAGVKESALRRVLERLTRERIVHSVDGSDRYEIFHDVLAEPIQAWRQERRLERERAAARRRQRRLIAVAAVALVALAVVAALAAWALSERSHARSQATDARARELEARALTRLSTDPNRSVRLALTAARLEPNAAAEDVLRTALITDRLRFRVRAADPVDTVAASPGGKWLAAGTEDGRVLLIDAKTGAVAHVLRTSGRLRTVEFIGPSTLVTARATGVAAEWNARTGRIVQTTAPLARARGTGIEPVLFTPRGRLAHMLPQIRGLAAARGIVAAIVQDPAGHNLAWVFDRKGRLLHKLPGIGVDDLAFSPDGKALVIASADGLTTMWEPHNGKRLRVFSDKDRVGKKLSSVNVAAFNQEGNFLATGSDDGGVRVWDVATGVRTYFLFGHTNPVTTIAWSPDGRTLASGSNDRFAIIWRIANITGAGSLAATLAGHEDAVRSVAFTRDGERLVSGSDDGTVRVWDAYADRELRLLGRADAPYIGARWAEDTIVAAADDGTVQVFDPKTRRQLRVMHGARASSFAVSRDGGLVALGQANGAATVWDTRSGAQLADVAGPAGILAVAISADGTLAASGDRRGGVRLFDAHTGALRWTASQEGEVTDLAFSPDGKQLASGSPSGGTVWSTGSQLTVLYRLRVPKGIVRLTYSPRGRLIASANIDGTARLWFAATGHPYRVLKKHSAQLTDVTFSGDGQLLATSAHDSDGRVWNVDTGRRVHVLRGHFGNVAAIAFSPDRRWLATAGPVSALVWPMSTGRWAFYLRGHDGALTSIAFSPDGHTILSASVDGTVRTFRCDICVPRAELVRLAERRLAAAH